MKAPKPSGSVSREGTAPGAVCKRPTDAIANSWDAGPAPESRSMSPRPPYGVGTGATQELQYAGVDFVSLVRAKKVADHIKNRVGHRPPKSIELTISTPAYCTVGTRWEEGCLSRAQ